MEKNKIKRQVDSKSKSKSRTKSKSKYSIYRGKAYERVKRPRSSYAYFIMDEDQRKKGMKGGVMGMDLSKKMSEMWSKTTDEEREPFDKMHEEDIDRYEDEIQAIDDHKKGKHSVKKSSKEEKSDKGRKKSVNRKNKEKETEESDESDEE